jgi:hypothetical protein
MALESLVITQTDRKTKITKTLRPLNDLLEIPTDGRKMKK